MDNNSKEDQKKISNALIDLIIICILAIIVFLLAASFDVFETLVEWSRKYEEFEIDEIFILLNILALAFGIFSIRRWKDLAREITLRKHANDELREAHAELERRVEERTVELSKANISFRQEITERKQVGDALKKSEHDFKILFDSTIDGLFVIDAETMKILLANQAITKMFGIDSTEDAIETNPLDFIVPDDRDRAVRVIAKDMFENDLRRIEEFKAITADGSEIWLSAVGTRTEYQGKLVGLVSIRDITESKLMEEQLRQAQKMEAVGQLTGGIAHDVNNLLNAILGNTELAMMNTDEADPLYMNLKRIRSTVMRTANLTRQLLIFSRKQPMDFATLNLNGIIDDFLKMLHRLIGEDITIETYLEPDLWSTRADAGNIEQLIMNLSVNARDAMPDGGLLTIKTENVVLDEEYTKFIPYARPGKFIRLSVEDTGTGMSGEIIEHIFEPFFSTKEVGEGTGLGLSVVYGIVKEHKGWINVYSESGSGTTFKIYFPASSGKAEEKTEEKISLKDIQGNGERILLVEDEEKVREMATTALGDNGYVVFEAQNAKDAMDIFAKEKGRFHLVFSDVVLPGDSGLKMVDHLLSHNPGLKVLMCSGYTNNKAQRKVMREKGIPFLQKPYSLPDLFKTIKDVL